MKSKHSPPSINDSTSPLTVSTQNDFVTALLNSPTPICVQKSLQNLYDALSTEIQQNTAVIKAGWQFDPKTGQTNSFVTLLGKNQKEEL